jgi:hypothetical protein
MVKKPKIALLTIIVLMISMACSFEGFGGGEKVDTNLMLTVTAGAQMISQAQKEPPTQQVAATKQEAATQQVAPQIQEAPQQPGDQTTSNEPTPTRQYTRSIDEIENLSDQFDSVKVRDTWQIYRPLLGKYDLESQRGWLKITGQVKTAEGYNNVFAQHVTSGDLIVIVKIGGVMTQPTQGAWIGFSPGDFSNNSQTVAIALDSYGYGYRVIMWECRTASFCVETHMVGQLKFKYPGAVYLRLTRRGSDYIGHYSENGKDWVFVGQTNGFPIITDQVVLGAGCMTCKDEFSALFDFVEFKVPH